MKNLKKLLAVLVVVVMVVTTMIPAFAASYTYSTQAQALYDIGLYKGSSTAAFEPDLGAALDRQQGVVMLIRLLGKEPAALALTSSEVNATLIIFSDADKLATWAKKHIAYAVLYKYVAGLPNGTFAPLNPLTGKELGTMLLRAAGYTVDAAGYAGACYQMQNLGVLTFSEAAKFNEKELNRDDLVGMCYASLQMKYKATGLTMIQTLINDKVVTEAKAIAAGVFNSQLYTVARAAVDAYKAGAITTLAEIAAAEAKKAAADAAVAKVVLATDKAALQKEIDARAAAIAAAKTTLMGGVNAAVDAFLAAPIATLTDIAAAEALGVTAQAKVATVADATVKADLAKKVADQLAVIAAKKAQISGAVVAVDTGSLTTAVLTFDKEMDAATIITANIKVDGVGVVTTNMTLSADKKVLTIAYVVPKNQSDNVRIQLNSLKDTQGIVMAAYDKTFVAKDVTDPKVLTIAVVNPKTLKIFTSEPLNVVTGTYVVTDYINAMVNITIGGSAGYAKITKFADEGYLLVEYSSPIPTGENAIVIADAKDSAGYKMAQYSGTIVVTADTVAPVATSVAYISRNQVKVTFSEQISSGGVAYGGVASFTFKEAAGTEVAIGTVAYGDTTATLTLPADMTVASIVGFDVTYINVQDTIGNAYTTKQTITGAAQDDTTAPTVTSITVIAGNKVRVLFSEAVTAADSLFVLYNASGTSLGAPVAATTVVNTAKTQYDITFAALTVAGGIDAGAYQVEVKAGYTDLSIRNNAGATTGKRAITALDTKMPTITAAVGTTVAGGVQVIEVIYSEAINTALMNNISAYYLGKTLIANVPLDTISGVSIVINSANKVTITVPNTGTAYTLLGTYGIKDTVGNVLATTAPNFGSIDNPFAISANYGPYLLAATDILAKATSATTIEISISAAKVLQGYSFTLADRNAFKFVAGAVYDLNLGTLNATLSSDATKVTLTTAIALQTDAMFNQTPGTLTFPAGVYPVTVWIDGTMGLVKDQNNQNVAIAKASAQAVTDGIKPTQQALIGEAITDGIANVIIPFSEPVFYAVAGIDSAVKVTVDSKVLYPETDYDVVIVAGQVVVKVNAIQGVAPAAGTVKSVTVQIITATNFKDAAGNVIVPGAAASVNATF